MSVRLLIYACFFISGASALVYEIVWQRMLTLVFGLSTLSVAAVLAAFLAGLAVGARLFGPAADRSTSPLRFYAAIELGIVLAALAAKYYLPLLPRVYAPVYGELSPGQITSNAVRFVLAFLGVGMPSLLIGATVPAMARLVAGWAHSTGVGFARFYAVNTLGSVAGAALAGFLLIRVWGVQSALNVAIAGNALCAVMAWMAGSRGDKETRRQGDKETRAFTPLTTHPSRLTTHSSGACPTRFAMIAAAVSGAAALGYQTAWIRLLAVYTLNSVYVFTMVVTLFLAALALGSALAGRIIARGKTDLARGIVVVQGLLALTGPALLLVVRRAVDLGLAEGDWQEARLILAQYALAAVVVFPPTLLIGMTLPLLVAWFAPGDSRPASHVGRIYAWNAVGNIAGAALTGAVLVPALGLRGTLLVLAATSFAVAAGAGVFGRSRTAPSDALLAERWHPPTDSARWRGFEAAVAIAFVLLVALLPADLRFYRPAGADEQVLYYAEGISATVHVSELETDGVRHRTLFVDSQSVAGTYDEIVTDQKMLAHLPLLLHAAPKRALTVGFGTGGTSYSMLLHLVAVDCAEIEPRVPQAYRYFLSENLAQVGPDHERDKFHLVLDDARAWLHVAPEPYDVIVTDCTSIQYRGNGNLYTTDYFRLMQGRLADGGIACAWVPLSGVTAEQLKVLVRSFAAVYPHTSVWYMINLPTDFVILVGTPQRLSLDLADWAQRTSRPGVHKDLARVGLADAYKLAACLLLAEDDVTSYVGPGLVHTDERPILDYMAHAARNRMTLSGNLFEMLEHRTNAAEYVTRWPDTSGGQAAPEEWVRWHEAAGLLMEGHAWIRSLSPDRAGSAEEAYREAAALVPDDELTRKLASP